MTDNNDNSIWTCRAAKWLMTLKDLISLIFIFCLIILFVSKKIRFSLISFLYKTTLIQETLYYLIFKNDIIS